MRAIDAPAEWGNPPAWRERLYDGLTLLLLMWPATGGMWLNASTNLEGCGNGGWMATVGSNRQPCTPGDALSGAVSGVRSARRSASRMLR